METAVPAKEPKSSRATVAGSLQNANGAKSESAPRMIRMRRASPRDATGLYDCLMGMFDECQMFYPPAVEADVIGWGLYVVNQGNTVVAECDGKIIGSVGLDLVVCPWNHKARFFNETWLYVKPEFRKGGTGVRLIQSAQKIAAGAGISLRIDEFWKYQPHLMGRMKERLGFHLVGSSHVYIPNDPNRDTAEH